MYCHVTRGQPRFFCLLEPSVATCLAILSSLILWTCRDISAYVPGLSALTFPDQFAPVYYHSVRHLSTIYLGSFSAICAVQLPDDESKSKFIRRFHRHVKIVKKTNRNPNLNTPDWSECASVRRPTEPGWRSFLSSGERLTGVAQFLL